MSRVDFDLHNALTRWQSGPFSLLVAAALIAAAYSYLRGDWLLAARGRRWPPGRTAAFLAGLVAVDVALQSPVATFTGMYFQAHVLQHLLLMVVAPPLLALGAPSTMLLQTASRKTKMAWLAVLRSRPFAILTHPIPVWALYFGTMFSFFLSSLINVAMHHLALMDVLNVVFLLGGCLYWWPMVGADPIVHWRMGYGARMVNVLLGGPPEVILGLAILSARTPIASMYTLSSTQAGGALLWISTEFAVVAGFIPIFWQWSRSDARTAARLDAQADARQAAQIDATQSGDAIPTSAAITDPDAPGAAQRLGRLADDHLGSHLAIQDRTNTISPHLLTPGHQKAGIRNRPKRHLSGLARTTAPPSSAEPSPQAAMAPGRNRRPLPCSRGGAGHLLPSGRGRRPGPAYSAACGRRRQRADLGWAGERDLDRDHRLPSRLPGAGDPLRPASHRGRTDLEAQRPTDHFRHDRLRCGLHCRYGRHQIRPALTRRPIRRLHHGDLQIPPGHLRPQPTHPAGRHSGARKYRYRADDRSTHPAGTQKTVSFPLHAERVANRIDINAAIPINFSSWHIPNPSFAVAQVGSTGQIEVLLQLTPEPK